VLAAGLAFVGASRVGDDIDRLERAEILSFQLEARVFEQAVLESKAATSGARRHRAAAGGHPAPGDRQRPGRAHLPAPRRPQRRRDRGGRR
jgi:hypothetical protein